MHYNSQNAADTTAYGQDKGKANPQRQPYQPGFEYLLQPSPIFDNPGYIGTGKLQGRVAIVTGGDSGIGRAISLAYAKEGADIAIVYYNEHRDACETKSYIEAVGANCLLLPGDLQQPSFAHKVVHDTLAIFGRVDIVVNNAGVYIGQEDIRDVLPEQLWNTFGVNVFAPIYMIQAVLPYLKPGSSIINTASVTAYQGYAAAMDYAASKAALVSLTRSLALSLAGQGIRVNAVAPGPVWTPLFAEGMTPRQVQDFIDRTTMKRLGQPVEIAPAFVYLASDESSYLTGQTIHVNGGMLTTS